MIKQTNNRHPQSILLFNVFVGKIRQNNADNRITDMETKGFSRRGTFLKPENTFSSFNSVFCSLILRKEVLSVYILPPFLKFKKVIILLIILKMGQLKTRNVESLS